LYANKENAMSDTEELIVRARDAVWARRQQGKQEPTALLIEGLADALTAAQSALVVAKADAWDEGAKWAAVECGAIADERNEFLVPGDNPYRAAAPEGDGGNE
jgi:hypothetical protein